MSIEHGIGIEAQANIGPVINAGPSKVEGTAPSVPMFMHSESTAVRHVNPDKPGAWIDLIAQGGEALGAVTSIVIGTAQMARVTAAGPVGAEGSVNSLSPGFVGPAGLKGGI